METGRVPGGVVPPVRTVCWTLWSWRPCDNDSYGNKPHSNEPHNNEPHGEGVLGTVTRCRCLSAECMISNKLPDGESGTSY